MAQYPLLSEVCFLSVIFMFIFTDVVIMQSDFHNKTIKILFSDSMQKCYWMVSFYMVFDHTYKL